MVDAQHALAHRARGADDFFELLALRRQCDEQRRGLNGTDLFVDERTDRIRSFIRGQIATPDDAAQERRKVFHRGTGLRRTISRKFAKIAPPSGVSTDSGWNCTP